jgi:protein-S-isoprenylcysteine O-methyltransferase Ste14
MLMADEAQKLRTNPRHDIRKPILRVAVVAGIAFLLLGTSQWPDGHVLHEGIEWLGLGLILVCIAGRTWCSLYIGGQKNDTLITDGPYSVTRNPLYLFSIIGAAGVGAQVGCVVPALVSAFITWVVFVRTAMIEESRLLDIFGETYRRYFAQVPRFWPKLSLWRDRATVQVKPTVVVSTFADAVIFLVAIPIAESLGYLHDIGWLPTYIRLP